MGHTSSSAEFRKNPDLAERISGRIWVTRRIVAETQRTIYQRQDFVKQVASLPLDSLTANNTAPVPPAVPEKADSSDGYVSAVSPATSTATAPGTVVYDQEFLARSREQVAAIWPVQENSNETPA